MATTKKNQQKARDIAAKQAAAMEQESPAAAIHPIPMRKVVRALDATLALLGDKNGPVMVTGIKWDRADIDVFVLRKRALTGGEDEVAFSFKLCDL